jgi:hypothetical protein
LIFPILYVYVVLNKVLLSEGEKCTNESHLKCLHREVLVYILTYKKMDAPNDW